MLRDTGHKISPTNSSLACLFCNFVHVVLYFTCMFHWDDRQKVQAEVATATTITKGKRRRKKWSLFPPANTVNGNVNKIEDGKKRVGR